MPKAKQISITVENRPGTLARVAQVLGEAKVSILAFATGTRDAEGYVQVIVDNVNKAKKALEAAALSYTEADVLHAELSNVPGALGQYAGKLASKDVNITFGYATTVKGSRKASIVLTVSDLEKAVRVR